MKWPDRVIVIGIILLIPGTALAIGAVHPWSYSIAEAVIFSSVTVALVKIWLLKSDLGAVQHSEAFSLIVPLVLFICFVLFQLLPLPPIVERVISPTTYEIYSRAFPGWPTQSSIRSVSSSPSVPGWLPLSISPLLTKTILLQFLAYSGFFLLVLLCCPTGSQCDQNAERRFCRVICISIVATASLVASIAMVEAATWNGKVMWVFTPYDWGRIRPDSLPRLIGPFVNPDRFANYLVLAFPLAFSGTVFESFLADKRRAVGFRLFWGTSALIIAAGILGSLSRAGWICLLLGSLVLVGICLKGDHVPFLFLGRNLNRHLVVTALLSLLFMSFICSMFLTGSSRMSQADLRLAQTTSEFHNVSPGARLAIWRDSAGIVRDFPVFGLGLGSWPDFYPHYRHPPWLNQFATAAHNDYLQLLTETGVIGFLLLGWFFVAAGIKLCKGLKGLPSSILPVYAALLAALGAMAMHEIVDFNLQTPSNALLFVLILGIALRMIGVGNLPSVNTKARSWTGRTTTSFLWMLSVACIFLSLAQDKVPYPYNVTRPRSVEGARALLRAHPADSTVHLWLAELLHEKRDNESQIMFQQEVRNAIWLEPTNPFARDHYANILLRSHYPALALVEISRSVFMAPSLEYHAYLASQPVVSPSLAVQKAVEKGLKTAVQSNFEGSVAALALFYERLGRFRDEGELLESPDCDSITAGLSTTQCLVLAGSAYSKARDLPCAERALDRAIQIEPDNIEGYQKLIILVFAPRHDLRSAMELIQNATQKHVDPYALYLALSEVADVAGDPVAAEAALSKAAELRPDFQTLEAVGLHYFNHNNFNRASFYLRRAFEMRPSSAQIAFYLGLAEQSNYQYSSAQRAYERAVALDPKNATYRTTLDSFKRTIADNSSKR